MKNLLRKLSSATFSFVFAAALFVVGASAVSAANFELSPQSGDINSSGKAINVVVQSGGEQLKSATAVITYDASLVEVSVADGNFFPVVSKDTNQSGRLVITGTLPIGNSVGVTGSGNLAVLTVKAKASSGQPKLNFECNATSTDDSNIINMENENLLATAGQCGMNKNGSYTLSGGGSTSTPTPTPAIGCNETCSTNSDCSNPDHICFDTGSEKRCRLASNTGSNSCSAPSKGGSEPSELPDELPKSGSSDGVMFLGMGTFFLLASASAWAISKGRLS